MGRVGLQIKRPSALAPRIAQSTQRLDAGPQHMGPLAPVQPNRMCRQWVSGRLPQHLLSCPLKCSPNSLLCNCFSFLRLDSFILGTTSIPTIDPTIIRHHCIRSDGPYTLTNSAALVITAVHFSIGYGGASSHALTRDRSFFRGRHRQNNELPAYHQYPVQSIRWCADSVKRLRQIPPLSSFV